MAVMRISNKQACVLTALYIITNCFSALYGVDAGRDIWISYTLASLSACLLWFLISMATDKYPDKDFFSLLELSFGRLITWIITLLFSLYAFSSVATSISHFGKFTQLTSLSKTPQIIIPLLILMLAAYTLRSGIEVLARCASLIAPFAIFVFLYFFLFGVEFIELQNIKPLLSGGIKPVIRGALSAFINQFGHTILLTSLLHNIKSEKRGKRRGILFGVVIGSVAISLIVFSTIATLGQAETAAEFYPVFTVLSIRNLGGFIQHMEILTSIATAFFVFFRAALGLYFLSLAVAYLFRLKSSRAQLIPLALLITSTTQLLYWNTMSLRKSMESDLAIILVAPLQFVIPVLACLIIWFKKSQIRYDKKKLN